MLPQPTSPILPDRTLTTASGTQPEAWVSLNPQVLLHTTADRHTILLQQQPIMVYAAADRLTMKAVAVQLVQTGQATVAEVSQGLGLPPSTLRDAVRAFHTAGVGGLLPAARGPQGPWKFTPERRQQALATAWATPTATWAELTASANAGAARPVSQRHVQRCLAAALTGRAGQRAGPGAAGEPVPPAAVAPGLTGPLAVAAPCGVAAPEPAARAVAPDPLAVAAPCGVAAPEPAARAVAPDPLAMAAPCGVAAPAPAARAVALDPLAVAAPCGAAAPEPAARAVAPDPLAVAAPCGVAASAPAARAVAPDPLAVAAPCGVAAPAPAARAVALDPLAVAAPCGVAAPAPAARAVAPDPLAVAAPRAAAVPTAVPPLTAAEQRYLARLRQGVDSAFGGGFLTLPFLRALDFPGLVARTFATLPDLGYTVLQMALAFFYLALFNAPALEATRSLWYGEFGLLVGRRRGPGLDKLRRFLKAVQTTQRSEAFVLAVAQQLVTMGVVAWQILYLDGHFIPYFGRHVVRQGYFTVRRLAMPGHEAYYANDPHGRPFFFLLTPASDAFTAVIPRLIAQVKAIVGDRWVAWGLTTVFDRGGFSVALFQQLDDSQVYWLTWLKAHRALQCLAEQLVAEAFQLHLIRLASTKVLVKLAELGVYLTGYGWARAIVVLDRQTGARLVLITNDRQRPSAELVRLLLLRWGQENFFKRMQATKQLDYAPGYTFAAADTAPLVANPQITVLRAQKKALQAVIARCQGALGALALRPAATPRQTEADAQQQLKLKRRITGLERQIQRLTRELQALPAKVPINQTLPAPLEQTDFARKRFFDELKLVAYQAEEQLLAVLAQSYTGKDRRVVLQQILHRGARIQLVGDTLTVQLKPFDRPGVQQAAAALCAALNAQEPRTLDKFHFRVVYTVQSNN